MIEPEITTLNTVFMMNETTLLLSNMASACEFLSNVVAASDEKLSTNTSGVFGVLSYAAEAAHERQSRYEDAFMIACGFTKPVTGNIANQQKDTVIPFPRKSS